MSFFIRGKNSSKSAPKAIEARKRKAPVKGRQNKSDDVRKRKKRPNAAKDLDEIIASDSEIDSDAEVVQKEGVESSSESDEESAQEKRLRLAKQYLAQLKDEASEEEDDEDDRTKDVIAERLKRDILEQAGRLQKQVADTYQTPESSDISLLRGHQLPVTCIVISADNRHIFSASKDCSVIKWDVESGKKVHTIPGGRKGTEKKHVGHTSHVLCMALTSDSKYLATGDRNKLIHIWNPDNCQLVHTFSGHRDAVSGLAFRRGTHQLFSASHDRTVKIWSLDEMAYVETLFGHQDAITAIDSLSRERAITSGGRDRSVRVWKVVEESQLVFLGHSGSIDCVCLVNEEHFVSASDNNSISLWIVSKKKPICTVQNAHSGEGNEENTSSTPENWITALAALHNTDLIASGSKDGFIKLWKIGNGFRSLTCISKINVLGFVNSLSFSTDGSLLVAGIGQEHKLGRWWRLKQAKNAVCVVKLKTNCSKEVK